MTPSTDNKAAVDFTPKGAYTKKAEGGNGAILDIPKEAVEFVDVGTYRISQYMQHMPMVSVIEAEQIDSFFLSKHFWFC